MFSKPNRMIAVLASLSLLLPSAAGARQPAAGTRPGYGGTLVWGSQFKPAPINPVYTTNTITSDLMNLIFNGLVRLNSKNELEPDLAERWEISPDGREYTFYLRKGVKFHDGVDLTARDVLFSFDQYRNPENHCPFLSRFTKINRVEVIDNYTFRIYLKEPVPYFIQQCDRPILPQHLLRGKNIEDNPLNYAPVGTGPFRFVRWDRNTDEMLLEYNPDYYEGRPFLDRIVIKIYPDASHLWTAQMRREVDLVQFINESDYQVLNKDPTFNTHIINCGLFSLIKYNLEDPVLSDPGLRKAIAYSIDVDGMLDRMPDIQGIKSFGPFQEHYPGYNPQINPLEYDPDKANKILTDEGWRDLNNDGILEKDGQDLEIRMLVDNGDPIHKKTALILRQQLAAVGIKLTLQYFDDIGELNEDYLIRHHTQAWLRYLPSNVLGEMDAVNPWYSGFTMPTQFWTYKNEQLDRLVEQAQQETNGDNRETLYARIHKLIYEDQPACFLFFHVGFFALSTRIGGADDYFNINMATYTMKNWYLMQQN